MALKLTLDREFKSMRRFVLPLAAIAGLGITSCSLFSDDDPDPIPPPVDIVRADSTGKPSGCPLCPSMKHIPAGSLDMGTDTSNGVFKTTPKHRVALSAFWLDSVEVTQEDYLGLIGKNPSYFNGATERHGNVGTDLKRPVEMVDWFEAALYCNARSKRDGLDTVYRYTGIRDSATQFSFERIVKVLDGVTIDYTKKGYRLPTEAEWEYACRAGTKTLFYWGDDFRIFSYYGWLDHGKVEAVAKLRPNAWGLYDMIGNVREWTGDWYADYDVSVTKDPTGPKFGTLKIQRGGFWSDPSATITVDRFPPFPEFSGFSSGFRCILADI